MLAATAVRPDIRPGDHLESFAKQRAVTYASGLALAHLFDVGSPNARICFAGPRMAVTCGFALISSTARLNILVLLSDAKRSAYRKYATPP
jgi:hypothetical protein